MVIDTSAVLVILFGEPEASRFIAEIEADPVRLMSTANVLETMLVVEARKGQSGSRELDLFFHKAQIENVSFADEHLEVARQAWRKYGKGNHPAALNFGDCFAYALAKVSQEPLLFKGNDFLSTDLKLVISRSKEHRDK